MYLSESASSEVLFFHLLLRSYDYNMHVEGYYISLEQCSQFQRFHLHMFKW